MIGFRWAAHLPTAPRPTIRRTRLVRCCADDSSSIRDLRAQLEAALAREEYKDAARLRDAIQLKTMDAKLAVEEANGVFYAAFSSGNLQAMNEIWGIGDHIQVIHPLASTIAGREAVMDSWRSILKGVRPRAFNITLEDVRIFADEAHAFVTCVEVINADDSQGRITATNIFEKQNGKWKITLHHGSEAPLRKKPSLFTT